MTTTVQDDFLGADGDNLVGRVPSVSDTGLPWQDVTVGDPEVGNSGELQLDGDGKLVAVTLGPEDDGHPKYGAGVALQGGGFPIHMEIHLRSYAEDFITSAPTTGAATLRVYDGSLPSPATEARLYVRPGEVGSFNGSFRLDLHRGEIGTETGEYDMGIALAGGDVHYLIELDIAATGITVSLGGTPIGVMLYADLEDTTLPVFGDGTIARIELNPGNAIDDFGTNSEPSGAPPVVPGFWENLVASREII